jgi:hypothetical protein
MGVVCMYKSIDDLITDLKHLKEDAFIGRGMDHYEVVAFVENALKILEDYKKNLEDCKKISE